MPKKSVKLRLVITFILLLILSSILFSCKTFETNANIDRIKIFENSLITSKNSNFNIYLNKMNRIIFEKSINIGFMVNLLDSYYNEIDPFLKSNNITKDKIRDNDLRIVLFKNTDNTFNNYDPIIKYVFYDILVANNNFKFDPGLGITFITIVIDKPIFQVMKEYFSKYDFTGLYSAPNIIFIHLKKDRFEDKTPKDKFLLESVLLHEYTHYLFQNSIAKGILQLLVDFLNNGDNSNFEKYEKMQPYITFLNEAFANLFSDYFEEYCFDIQDFNNYRLDESKVKNILENKYKENKIDIEKKDASIIIDKYSKKIEVRQYFFDFLLYLINLNGFENFKNFISSIYMNETNTIDELFTRYYQKGIVEIFENWRK